VKQENPAARLESPAFRRGEEVNCSLRDRIADVKRLHDFDSDDISCPCGYRFDSKIDQYMHFADVVIAELAGYAIVELPEPDYVDEADDDGHKGYGFNGGDFEGWYAHGGRVYAAEGDMSPRDARELAAALLAAAEVAERDQ